MNPALCALPLYPSIPKALQALLHAISQAARHGHDVILFPETCLTGLDLTGDPARDLPLGLSLGSPEVQSIRAAAARHGMHVAFGWLERDGDVLYDSALLIDPSGQDVLHYRRVSPGWMVSTPHTASYGCGSDVPSATCALGRVVFLLCGDLFDESLAAQAAAHRPDVLLYPFARAMTLSEDWQREWDDEFPDYLAEWNKIAPSTLAANCQSVPDEDNQAYIGGGWHVRHGAIASREPLAVFGR